MADDWNFKCQISSTWVAFIESTQPVLRSNASLLCKTKTKSPSNRYNFPFFFASGIVELEWVYVRLDWKHIILQSADVNAMCENLCEQELSRTVKWCLIVSNIPAHCRLCMCLHSLSQSFSVFIVIMVVHLDFSRQANVALAMLHLISLNIRCRWLCEVAQFHICRLEIALSDRWRIFCVRASDETQVG